MNTDASSSGVRWTRHLAGVRRVVIRRAVIRSSNLHAPAAVLDMARGEPGFIHRALYKSCQGQIRREINEMLIESAYGKLIGLLGASGARYRIIEHTPEGRTDIASAATTRRVGMRKSLGLHGSEFTTVKELQVSC